jgi:hypothetical protein
MITFELTEEKAQILAELLDLATKAGGLQVAKVALPLMDDLMTAVKQSKETESNPSE